MAEWRVTIRIGGSRHQYVVGEVTADSLRDAMRIAADRFAEAAGPAADLVEIRAQVDPEARDVTPERA